MTDTTVWIPYSPSLHESTLQRGGKEKDGSLIVIGRAHYKGHLVPGKVSLRDKKCYISFNGDEVTVPTFEVLVNTPGFVWKEGKEGSVPSNAVIGGKTDRGEVLYVGRAKHGNLKVPGKVHPSHRCLYLPYGMKEHASKTYEVLVREIGKKSEPMKAGVEWVSWQKGAPWPSQAVQAGVYQEKGSKSAQFIARRRHQSSMLIGYAYMNGPFYTGFHGKEVSYPDFEVLVDRSGVFPKENLI